MATEALPGNVLDAESGAFSSRRSLSPADSIADLHRGALRSQRCPSAQSDCRSNALRRRLSCVPELGLLRVLLVARGRRVKAAHAETDEAHKGAAEGRGLLERF